MDASNSAQVVSPRMEFINQSSAVNTFLQVRFAQKPLHEEEGGRGSRSRI
jgi:hypothetical protein